MNIFALRALLLKQSYRPPASPIRVYEFSKVFQPISTRKGSRDSGISLSVQYVWFSHLYFSVGIFVWFLSCDTPWLYFEWTASVSSSFCLYFCLGVPLLLPLCFLFPHLSLPRGSMGNVLSGFHLIIRNRSSMAPRWELFSYQHTLVSDVRPPVKHPFCQNIFI